MNVYSKVTGKTCNVERTAGAERSCPPQAVVRLGDGACGTRLSSDLAKFIMWLERLEAGGNDRKHEIEHGRKGSCSGIRVLCNAETDDRRVSFLKEAQGRANPPLCTYRDLTPERAESRYIDHIKWIILSSDYRRSCCIASEP